MKEENIDHLFETDWNLLDEINKYYESLDIDEAIQKKYNGSKEERVELKEKSDYYLQKLEAMAEKYSAILKVVYEMYEPGDKLKKKDIVKIKLLADKIDELINAKKSVITKMKNTLQSFWDTEKWILDILKIKEEKLSSLETEEKTITEAETLIDKQEGKDIGEK